MSDTYPAYDPVIRTRTLARIVGPYLIVMGLMLITRGPTLHLLLPAFMQDGPLVLATGAFTTMVGFTIIAAHHHFSSAAAIAVSVIGIAAAIKGALLMIAPMLGAPLTAAIVRIPFVFVILSIITIAIGGWLTCVGWLPKSGTPS